MIWNPILIYAMNEFKVLYCKIILIIDTIFITINIIIIIKFQGLFARQPYLCKIFPIYVLLGHFWWLGTFVNRSCDIKIDINSQNCCINLAVKGSKDVYRIFFQEMSYGQKQLFEP